MRNKIKTRENFIIWLVVGMEGDCLSSCHHWVLYKNWLKIEIIYSSLVVLLLDTIDFLFSSVKDKLKTRNFVRIGQYCHFRPSRFLTKKIRKIFLVPFLLEKKNREFFELNFH